MLISTIDYNEYVGRIGVGKVDNGKIAVNQEVMLMNHHGSHVSEEFFKKVSPSYSVISCGKDNKYGHPRADNMELLKKTMCLYFVQICRGQFSCTVTDRS